MHRRRVAVLVSDDSSYLHALMMETALSDYPAQVVVVISDRDATQAIAYAERYNIAHRVLPYNTYGSKKEFEQELHNTLLQNGIEIICFAGFWRILTAEFLANWQERIINVHPSLLPAFKGFYPHEDAISARVSTTGCTVHYVVPEVDAGPIILQTIVPVYEDDTVDTLASRIRPFEIQCLTMSLRLLAAEQIYISDEQVYLKDAYSQESEPMMRSTLFTEYLNHALVDLSFHHENNRITENKTVNGL